MRQQLRDMLQGGPAVDQLGPILLVAGIVFAVAFVVLLVFDAYWLRRRIRRFLGHRKP